ncbi:MAG: hypothetical protein JWM54_201 [Acidobacteriaceae bacterium]|nr:hypothetical protein [Acidobacteriaceae bacterium]
MIGAVVTKQVGLGSGAAGRARKRAANGRFQGSKRVVAKADAEKAPEKKKRPIKNVEEYADREFRREFPEIFDGLCGEAKKGGATQARLLAQWSKAGDAKTSKRRGKKSLSEMLLDELKRRQDEREAAAEMAAGERERSSKGATSGGDAEQD